MSLWLLLIAPPVAAWAAWMLYDRSRHKRAALVARNVEALGDEAVPSSIHPEIDPAKCMGSGACVRACPEKEILGIVDGKAKLVNPLACVGHGACAAACPVGAISLVFGTAKRGVELPVVKPDFQTNQPGIYIAGELGGMGLIRNAVEQGRQAAQSIVAAGRRAPDKQALDAVVVGAGPAGISATLKLVEEGLRVELLEQDAFGGTIRHYPRAKIVMTGSFEIPRFGKVKKRTMSKEDLLGLWEDIRDTTALPVATGERVEAIKPAGDAWVVKSSGGERRAANVVLALGRRGAPRKLGVPGEDLEKVSYRVLEPEAFKGQRVLVVGGGNAAADCAIALIEQGGCQTVSLSYRRPELARLRQPVREAIDRLAAAGRLEMLLPTEVLEIQPDRVLLKRSVDGEHIALPNDAVVVQIGGTSPLELLQTFGIQTVTKRGEA